MRKLIFLLFIFLLFFCFSCSTAKLVVLPIDQVSVYQNNAIIYALPKTKIIVQVEVDKIIETKAPFAEYSEKYLGKLTNKVQQSRTYWQITKVEFQTVPMVDTDNIYAIVSPEITPAHLITLSKEGFIISINNNTNNNIQTSLEQDTYALPERKYDLSTEFDQLSVDQIYKEVYDTVFKTVSYDSVFKKVLIIKKTKVLKTKEELAKDLADMIFSLRDDRLMLITGDMDQIPQAQTLEIMLNRIDKLEKKYLSLFIGKRDTIPYNYVFTYIPEEMDSTDEVILFKFSEDKGILPVESIEGQPVILTIQNLGQTQKIKDFTISQARYKISEKEKNGGLYYRIPQRTILQLKKGNLLLGEKETFIAQLGAVAQLPYKLFFYPNIQIEFYPDLGAIKSITKK